MASDKMYGIAKGQFAITGNDSADLSQPAYGFRVNSAGDVRFTDDSGNTHTLTYAAGAIEPTKVVRVFSTSTTATGITGYILQ